MSILNVNVKKVVSIILALILVLSNFGIIVNAQVSCTIPYVAAVNNKQISANTYVRYSNELYLYPGDIVYLNFTYTPSNASVWFGLSTPSNQFRYASGVSGKLQRSFIIKEEGIHKVKIQNNSSASIIINGKFSTGCSYPFRGTNVPTALSRGYSASHYGLDIIDTYPNSINGREIYSIGSGTVLFEGPSQSSGNYIAILYDGGYTARYLHMQSRSTLKKDDVVTYETFIGYVGNTGESSGPHLHLDVNTVNATSGGSGNNAVNSSTTIDPKKLFPQIGFSQ